MCLIAAINHHSHCTIPLKSTLLSNFLNAYKNEYKLFEVRDMNEAYLLKIFKYIFLWFYSSFISK